jgi:capsular polysaccharide transport system permease protein
LTVIGDNVIEPGASGRPFLGALRAQARVLNAMVRREIDEQLGRGGHRLILGIIEPIFVLAIAIVWHTLLHWTPAYGTSKVLFIGTGLYATFLFVHLSGEFRSRAKGSVALRRFPVEKTLDVILAASFMRAFVYGCGGIVGFGLVYFEFSHDALPRNWPAALLGLLSLVMLGLGMGLCNAAIEQMAPIWRYIWQPIARGLILFSGVIYVPDFTPVHIRDALKWNPVLQGVELFRMGFYPGYPDQCYQPLYLWPVACSLILAGLCVDRVFRRRLDET